MTIERKKKYTYQYCPIESHQSTLIIINKPFRHAKEENKKHTIQKEKCKIPKVIGESTYLKKKKIHLSTTKKLKKRTESIKLCIVKNISLFVDDAALKIIIKSDTQRK